MKEPKGYELREMLDIFVEVPAAMASCLHFASYLSLIAHSSLSNVGTFPP